MSKRDWQTIQVIAVVGGAVVAAHGITSPRWEHAHSILLVVAALASVGPQLDELLSV